MIGSKKTGLLGGGPPPKAPHPSSRLYTLWMAAQNAKKTQAESDQKEREKKTQKTLNELDFYKRGPPKASKDAQWEGSQASSQTTAANPESVMSVTSTGTDRMKPSEVIKLSQAAESTDPVALKNMGNTCFVNARKLNY